MFADGWCFFCLFSESAVFNQVFAMPGVVSIRSDGRGAHCIAHAQVVAVVAVGTHPTLTLEARGAALPGFPAFSLLTSPQGKLAKGHIPQLNEEVHEPRPARHGFHLKKGSFFSVVFLQAHPNLEHGRRIGHLDSGVTCSGQAVSMLRDFGFGSERAVKAGASFVGANGIWLVKTNGTILG